MVLAVWYGVVIRQKDHWFEARLRYQEPIERILVNGRQPFDLRRMFAHDRQVIEPRKESRLEIPRAATVMGTKGEVCKCAQDVI
jgi:hypothetical protein